MTNTIATGLLQYTESPGQPRGEAAGCLHQAAGRSSSYMVNSRAWQSNCSRSGFPGFAKSLGRVVSSHGTTSDWLLDCRAGTGGPLRVDSPATHCCRTWTASRSPKSL